MKNSVLVIFFAALLTFAFSSETGTFSMGVSSADAKSDSKSSSSRSDSSSKSDSKSSSSRSDSSSKSDSKSRSDSSSKSDSKSKSDSSSKDKEEKVTICHFPPGNPENMQTLSVDESAVDAHVAEHGDTIGECVDSEDESAGGGCVCPPGVSTCVCADGSSSNSSSSSSATPSSSHREVMGQ